MKKLLILFLLTIPFCVRAQTYTLNYDSIRVGKTPNSSILIPSKLFLKGLPKGNLSIKDNGQVIHNDTVYATVGSLNRIPLISNTPYTAIQVDSAAKYLKSVNATMFGAMGDSTNSGAKLTSMISYAAANNVKNVYVGPGAYLLESEIVFRSNITFTADPNARFYLASGANIYFGRNYSANTGTTARDSNITVTGGKWYGNSNNETRYTDGTIASGGVWTNATLAGTYFGFGFFLNKIDNLNIGNLRIENTEAWAIAHFACNKVKIHDISFNQSNPGTNQDGVSGWSSNLEIDHISGRANDDLIGLGATGLTIGANAAIITPQDYSNVSIHDISPTLEGNLTGSVRPYSIYAFTGATASNITVERVFGITRFGPRIGAASIIGTGIVKNIRLINQNVSTTSNASFISIGYVTADDIYTESIFRSESVNPNYIFVVGVNAIVNTLTIKDADLYQYSPSGSGSLGTSTALVYISDATGSLKNLYLSNVKYLLGNTTDRTVLIKTTNGTAFVPHVYANGLNITLTTNDPIVISGTAKVAWNNTEVAVTKTNLTPSVNDIILDRTTNTVQQYNGTSWVPATATAAGTTNQIDIYQSTGAKTPATISGDATLSAAGALTLKNTGTAGTYKSVTTDAQGRVTAGTNPTTLAGYGITDGVPASRTLTINGTALDLSANRSWTTEVPLTFSSPLVRTTNTISIPAATTSVNGYLTSTDWNTFNNKLSTATAASTYVPYSSPTGPINFGSQNFTANGTVTLGSAVPGSTKDVAVLYALTVGGNFTVGNGTGGTTTLATTATNIGTLVSGAAGTGIQVNATGKYITEGYSDALTTPTGIYGYTITAEGYKLGRVSAANLNTFLGTPSYSEGSWTPLPPVGVTFLAGFTGHYTKVGNLVTLSFEVTVSGISGTPSNSFYIGNLPFTNSTLSYGAGSIAYQDIQANAPTALINKNTASIYFYNQSTSLTETDFLGKTVRGTIVYSTTN